MGGGYSKYLQNATLGVDYFFVLSGYGLMRSYRDSMQYDPVSSIRFGVSKMHKIYFSYVLSLLVFLPYCLYFSINENGLVHAIFKTSIKYAACLLLIQSMSGTIAYAHAINGVCWFLSAIFIIYIMCPVLMKRINTNKNTTRIRVMCFICIAVCALVKAVLLRVGARFGLDDLSYSFPFARLPYVAFGMWLCRLLETQQIRTELHRNFWEDTVAAVVAISWFSLRNSCNMPIFLLVCVDLSVCGLLVYNYAQEKSILSQKLASSVFAKLGGSMMYVYLFHYPVVIYIDLLFKDHRYVFGETTGIIEVIIITLLTIVCAMGIKKLDQKYRFRALKS